MNEVITRNVLPALEKKYLEAKALSARHKFIESNKLLDAVSKQLDTVNDKKFIADVLMLSGDNHFNSGSYSLALNEFLAAEKICKELKLMKELAEVENNLGAIYMRVGLYGHALFKNLEALTYSFQTNDEYLLCGCLMNSSLTLFDTGYTEKAFRALDTAMLVCGKHAGDEEYEKMRLVILNNKATFYIGLKRWNEALALLKEARVIVTKYGISDRVILIDSNISQCLMKLNRVDEAFKRLNALIKQRKNAYDDLYVTDLVKIGMIYGSHYHDEAGFLKYLGKALKLAEMMNLPVRQIFICQQLVDHYKKTGNTTQAAEFEMKLKALEDQDSRNKQTGGMEKLFDTNMLAVENMLREKEQKPEFLNRYDYMIGTYSYTVRGVTRHIPLSDIGFCEVRGNYMYIHTFVKNAAGKPVLHEGHKLRKTMKDFISEIDTSAAFFARIHNSFLINLYRLPNEELKGGNSVFIGGQELKISDTYRSEFKKKLNAFFEQELSLQQ